MRTFELLLAIANVLAFVLLHRPLPRRVPWLRHAVPVALLASGAQLLVEGWRWQMLPAYVLAGALSGVWVLRAATGRRRAGRLAAALATGLGVVVLAISIALPVVVPMIQLPRPTGPFGIGTLTYHWVDADRPEPVTAQPDDRRELMVQVWYPADAGAAAPRAAYLPDADVLAPALARFLHLPAFALGHLKDITTNAIPAAPVADDQRRYPVVVLLVGQGGTYRQVQTFQVEELVSHGYVVAAVDQPYAVAAVVFPDGRQVGYDPRLLDRAFLDPLVPDLALDVGFTLDQLAAVDRADPNGVLTGRLDLRRAGLVGHSLGGIVGGQACLREPRIRACLLEDAFMPADVVREGLQQPAMWITRDAETMRLERRRAGGWAERDIAEHLDTMRAVFDGLPGDGYYVEVPGIFHLDMTDAPLLSPLAPELGIAGPIGVERAHAIINAYTLAFFDRHLRDRPAPLLDGPSAQFPDVHIETRGAARP